MRPDGREHAEQVAKSLIGKAASIKVLELPNLPDKGDVTDWLEAGGSAEELAACLKKALNGSLKMVLYSSAPTAACNDADPSSLALWNAVLDGIYYLSVWIL